MCDPRYFHPRHKGIVMGLLALCVSLPALAEEQTQDGSDEGASNRPWTLMTGVGVADTARYLGSDHTKLRLIPMIKASYQTDWGRFALGGGGSPGASWSISPDRNSEIGLLIGRNRGRKASDDTNLAGLGDIKSYFEYGAFAAYRFGPFKLQGNLIKGASSENAGELANLNVEYEYPLSASLKFTSGIGVAWASDGYSQRYFGVDAQQSANSGLAVYSAKAGIRDVRASLGLTWRPAPHWIVLTQLSATRLQGDAADSPIVKKATQAQFVSGFAYLW